MLKMFWVIETKTWIRVFVSITQNHFQIWSFLCRFIRIIDRDRHILKNDLKKWGAGDPLNFSNFFAKIVFLVLLYKTVTKFLCKSTNFGYFWPLQNRYFSTKTVKNSSKIEISQKAITRTKKYICTNILHIIVDIFVKKFRQKNLF